MHNNSVNSDGFTLNNQGDPQFPRARVGRNKRSALRRIVFYPRGVDMARVQLRFGGLRRRLTRPTWTFFLITAALMLCGVSSTVLSGEPQMRCGNTVITASPAKVKGGETYVRNFKITLRNDSGDKTFEFNPENDFLNLSCFRSASSEYLLINHICSGTGCSESNYGVVKLPSFQVLLMPTDRWKGNNAAASTLLGTTPPKPDCEIKSSAYLCLHSEQE
jgi:hypothetical protein